jgi:hypothetical protein
LFEPVYPLPLPPPPPPQHISHLGNYQAHTIMQDVGVSPHTQPKQQSQPLLALHQV